MIPGKEVKFPQIFSYVLFKKAKISLYGICQNSHSGIRISLKLEVLSFPIILTHEVYVGVRYTNMQIARVMKTQTRCWRNRFHAACCFICSRQQRSGRNGMYFCMLLTLLTYVSVQSVATSVTLKERRLYFSFM